MVIKKERSLKPLLIVFGLVVILALAYVVVFAFILPLPKPTVEQQVYSQKITTSKPKELPFPTAAQVAIRVPSFNVQTSGDQIPLPTASVAKAVTALTILEKAPLSKGETGQVFTVSAADVQIYNQFVAEGGSVFKVVAGEQLNQYQALQALLLPSANNIAVSLTRWVFGSDQAYLDYANQLVERIGMTNTNISDSSGFSPNTTSTTSDLSLLGAEFLKNPVLAEIVNQKQATILGREVKNVNSSLGVDGINGIKTGFTHVAGGCLLFAAEQNIFGQQVAVIGAILGAPTRDVALAAAPELVAAMADNFEQVSVVEEGESVARVRTAWGQETAIVAEESLNFVAFKGESKDLEVQVDSKNLSGGLSIAGKTVHASLQGTIDPPGIFWRLTHPLEFFRSEQ